MEKALCVSFFILFSALVTFAGHWVEINSRDAVPAEIQLISSDYQSSRISFEIPGFELIPVNTAQGPASIIMLEDASPLLEAGAPDLLKLTTSVLIPDLAGMDVRVLSSEFTDYENILIAPSKGNLTRDINPANVPYTFGEVYTQDAFYPGTLAELRDPYIIRDYRGQTVVVYPFQYNPITRTLRVYHSMDVEVFKVNDNGVNPLNRDGMPEKIAVEYAAIYDLHFLNKPQNLTDYTPVSEMGNMLIISYGDFMTAMQPLVDWRIQTGTPVEIVDVATIGGSTQIKTYIADYYTNNGLTFVLLVGDAPQVPSSYASGDSDNNYSYIVGSDHYPDVFIGRFSAETVAQVETQVERTLTYEKNPDMGFDWFSRSIGIASNQGPGDDGEYDYQHIRNLADDLMNFTYTWEAELFDGSQGGNDASGNPSPTQVATEINTGASIINYTGHGSTNSWSTSGFSSTNVNSLTNNGMWPFIWSVACVNGNFVGTTCFAEAWLRATNSGEPSGAVATMMSTINQSWNPPMCAQDEMVDVLVETYPGNINRTFGAASMHGCMQMNDEYGSGGNEMTDTWVCFGDPALHVRTAFPQTMTASYQQTLNIGANSLVITCDANGGTACLIKDGDILSTGIISGGAVTLTFPAQNDATTLTLTITAFNFLPHIYDIDVMSANMVSLVFDEDHVIDITGNNNGLLDFGESVTYTIDLLNEGDIDAIDVDVTLEEDDQYITITDNQEMYPLIPAGQSVGIPEGFALDIADDIPDGHLIDFTITATDTDNTTWIIEYQAMVYAPALNIGAMVIDDATGGNGNGRLDPGETVVIKIDNFNSGHCPGANTMAELQSDCQYLTFTSNTFSVGTLELLGHQWAEFEVEVDPDAPYGITIAHFDYVLTSGSYVKNATFLKKIGLIYEDWETGDFNRHNWVLGGDMPFVLTDVDPFEGVYSSKSGSIGDNEQSIFSINVEVLLDDSVSFYFKTSSQLNKDWLKFFCDNSLKGFWSGTGDGWQRVAFPVVAGNHTFEWTYEKDGSGTSGNDCVWVDFISFPPILLLSCNAGPDDYTCVGNDYQCMGEAASWTSVEWTSSGDGSFNDPHILEPMYTPGSGDISNGNVILTITAEDAGYLVEDEMNLLILATPEAPLKPNGPEYINPTITASSEYLTDAVQNADDYEWSVDPVEAGTFESNGISGVITWNSSYVGSANISVKAMNICGDGLFSESLEVQLDNPVDIAELSAQDVISVYPNPNNGKFNILASSQIADANIMIFNIVGEKVFSLQTNMSGGETKNIGLEAYPKGLYILSITTADFRFTEKLIIK
jgi:hypothetical protein